MNLKIEDFEGPLDLLLHLVKVSKMDIYKVNISYIIDEYLKFIKSIDKYDIDISSEYLVMSSELIHLKSRKLLNLDEEEQDEYEITSEEDLRNRLIEYEKYKNMTKTFQELEENRMNYYTKLPENLKEYIDNTKIVNSDVTIDDLVKAFLDMQKRVSLKKPIVTKVTKIEYSIKKRINEIRKILKIKKRVPFTDLFDIITKDNLVVTLLSVLDMSKNNEIRLSQEKMFSTIMIESK